MIKLNNKNITYVALADTNNSIKAPKEIWYADSANSVKLVYRRKDALIEGEDYEKYHWLDGDGSAYIDTNIVVDVPSLHISTSFTKKVGNNTPLFGSRDFFSGNGSQIWCLDNGNLRLDIITNGNNWIWVNSSDIQNINQLIVDCPNKVININEITLSSGVDDLSIKNSSNTFKIYSLELLNSSGSNNVPYHGAFGNFTLNDSTHSFNLIPCKLLKPVPKWLDANGIRRQVGECGMIDLVSGKFYGNVNSVGTFTVENYYERKEWLVGDGSAYIDTDIIVDVPSLYINTKFTTTDSSYYEPLFGSRNQANYNGSHIWYLSEDNQIRVDVLSSDNSALHCNIQSSINSLILDVPNNIISINNVSESGKLSDYSIKNSVYTFHIFNMKLLGAVGSIDRRPYSGALSGFTLNDSTHSLNLIPCTLTMDLPASMDANNIARTKGTSGMWDLVSDRFYGNVANSGTFKAVNLAEGVDYEVHQWLQGRNGAYINTEYIITTVEDILEGKIRYDGTIENPDGGKQYICGMADVGTNKPYVYVYIANNNKLGCIYKLNNSQWDYTTVANEHTFRMSNDGNNTTVTDNEVVYLFNNQLDRQTTKKCFLFNYNRGDTESPTTYFHGDIAYFKITDTSSNTKMSLIPVKLLRSIPAKYDANGIARQANECGMYDTANDVFYGNVASSGTFSVSDDS